TRSTIPRIFFSARVFVGLKINGEKPKTSRPTSTRAEKNILGIVDRVEGLPQIQQLARAIRAGKIGQKTTVSDELLWSHLLLDTQALSRFGFATWALSFWSRGFDFGLNDRRLLVVSERANTNESEYGHELNPPCPHTIR